MVGAVSMATDVAAGGAAVGMAAACLIVDVMGRNAIRYFLLWNMQTRISRARVKTARRLSFFKLLILLLGGVRECLLLCQQHLLVSRRLALVPHTLLSVCHIIVSTRCAAAGEALLLQMLSRPLPPRLPPATAALPLLMPLPPLVCSMRHACVMRLVVGGPRCCCSLQWLPLPSGCCRCYGGGGGVSCSSCSSPPAACGCAGDSATRRRQRRQRQQQRRWQ